MPPDVVHRLLNLGLLLVLGAAIGVVIGTILLRAASQWVTGRDVPFGSASLTIILCAIVDAVVGIVIGYSVGLAVGFGGAGWAAPLMADCIAVPTALMIQSGIISVRQRVSYARGLLISLIMLLLVVLIGGIIGALVFGLLYAMR